MQPKEIFTVFTNNSFGIYILPTTEQQNELKVSWLSKQTVGTLMATGDVTLSIATHLLCLICVMQAEILSHTKTDIAQNTYNLLKTVVWVPDDKVT